MELREKLSWVLVMVLITMLAINSKGRKEIVIPEQKGSFTVSKPQPNKVDSVDEKVIWDFKKLPEQKKVEAYKKAVSKKIYKEVREDEKIIIETKSIVQNGVLESQEINYIIKPRTIQVKEPKINVFAGVSTRIEPIISPSINIHLKTPKSLYTVGYEPQQNRFNVGIAFKLF